MSIKPRPELLKGVTVKAVVGCGTLYITINVDGIGKPFEVFAQIGKAGGCSGSHLEAIARLISLSLRQGAEIEDIAKQLEKIRCPSPSINNGCTHFSCSDAIAKVLESYKIQERS
ncbi:MAG: TSCPD domain-containing protein [Candidatus Omnitrophica bacterium]|nr:TSCPD domain-containing protein [Candidatus Omnitrophota bacterium]